MSQTRDRRSPNVGSTRSPRHDRRVGDISTKSTVRRRIAVSQNLSARADQSFDHDPHIALQGWLEPCSQHQAVHLIENDLLVFEYRAPAKAIDVEPARASQIDDAQSDY